jgi:hypothetical protein
VVWCAAIVVVMVVVEVVVMVVEVEIERGGIYGMLLVNLDLACSTIGNQSLRPIRATCSRDKAESARFMREACKIRTE